VPRTERDVVWECLLRCGVTRKVADEVLPLWGPQELHLLVAHFLRLRFPIVLALNKAELPTVNPHYHTLARHPAACDIGICPRVVDLGEMFLVG
jgi:hypothetical protein